MMKYEIEERKYGSTWIHVIGENAKKERMTIEIVHCTNPGGKNSLPYAWHNNGWTNKVMKTWIGCNTYVHDSEGNCYGGYNVTEIYDGKRNVINFDWMLEDTRENMIKIVEACMKLFEAATGKSATEQKIDHIMEVAKERGVEVATELPVGWKELHSMTDPVGAVTITNGKERLVRNVNGKLHKNPEFEKMLMIM